MSNCENIPIQTIVLKLSFSTYDIVGTVFSALPAWLLLVIRTDGRTQVPVVGRYVNA